MIHAHARAGRGALQLKAAWELTFHVRSNVPLFFQDELCLVRFSLSFLVPPLMPLSSPLASITLATTHSHTTLDVSREKPHVSWPPSTPFKGSIQPSFKVTFTFLLRPILPALSPRFPNEHKDKMRDLGRDIRGIATVLLERAEKEKAAGGMKTERDESIIGVLGKGVKVSSLFLQRRPLN